MNEVLVGDCRKLLQAIRPGSVQCVVTSPPYWGLRDYGTASWEGGDSKCKHIGQDARTVSGGEGKQYTNIGSNRVYSGDCKCGATRIDNQLGLERTPEEYVDNMTAVFREVRRVLREDGTLWLNLGDSYCSIGHKKSHSGYGTTGLAGGIAQEHSPTRRENDASSLGLKHKDLVGIPWRVAFALQADGWYLRSDIIWHKRNPMPESVTDRPTKAHEYLFLLAKSQKYYYNADAIKEPASPDSHARYGRGRSDSHKWADGGPGNQSIAKSFEHMRKPGVHPKAALANSGIKANESFCNAVKDVVDFRNKRTVWEIATQSYSEAHFATFPPDLVKPCILAGSKAGDLALDPFSGSGTVGAVCAELGRSYLGLELNPDYAKMRQEERSIIGMQL